MPAISVRPKKGRSTPIINNQRNRPKGFTFRISASRKTMRKDVLNDLKFFLMERTKNTGSVNRETSFMGIMQK